MNKIKRIMTIIALALVTVTVQAQETVAPPTDVMRSNGKIYVVVAVVVTILVGLFAYLLQLDRKISRLEKK